MKIFVTGGSGNLGKELINVIPSNYEVISPTRQECDLLDSNVINKLINFHKPNLVIHLAAFVDTLGCELDINRAIDNNIIGTINIVRSCLELNCKFVYVSSEYIFEGNKGNYTVDDRPNPINVYGKTKASAEYIVSILPNYQIIRAPFIKVKYPKVYTNQYCSSYFIEVVIKRIFDNILNNPNKIVHIANTRKSLYEHYLSKNLNPDPIPIPNELLHITPIDTSLIDNSI
jgi:dTDP-4-dehydrorhamnose reductase